MEVIISDELLHSLSSFSGFYITENDRLQTKLEIQSRNNNLQPYFCTHRAPQHHVQKLCSMKLFHTIP